MQSKIFLILKMRYIIIGEIILVFYNTLLFAQKFKIGGSDVQCWEINKESYELKKLKILGESSIPFGFFNTLILMKLVGFRWSIFYWLGEQTTIDHKLKTAALVGELCYQIVHSLTDPKEKELLYEIRTNKKGAFHLNPWTSSSTGKLIKLSNSDVIPTINRETESNESQLFKTYFGQYGKLFKYEGKKNNSDLYEIKEKDNEISIDLIPSNTDIYKKNKKNVYVYSNENTIVRSNDKNNSQLTNMQWMLVNHLINEKVKNKIDISMEECCKWLLNKFDEPKVFIDQKFQRNTEGESSMMLKFLNTLLHGNTSEKNESKFLFKVQASREAININSVPLYMEQITELTCYILQNTSLQHSYVYLGTKCSLDTIKYVLETQERYINENEGWKKLIFAAKTDWKTPAVFWVNFLNYKDYLTLFSWKMPIHFPRLIHKFTYSF